ncbi:MAG: UDP-2,3-diacylglucosamine hydrolase [Planctomycetota bacterium]|jgi:UDP-2,3-diacylglucosamine hydrolase
MPKERVPVVPLPVGTQVIGDLHLDIRDDQQVARFCARLKQMAGIPRLIILGDLFEYWVGPAQLKSAEVPLSAMLALTAAGTAIDVIPGNRDFLMDRGFEERSGATLHPTGFLGQSTSEAAGGSKVLFIHGDELCSLDLPYQRLRAVLRSKPARLFARSIPAPLALRLAGRLRGASKQAIAVKPNATMEQQAPTCVDMAQAHGCETLVCGHAHRFRDEQLEGGPRWLVVDAFGGERDTLEISQAGRLEVLKRTASA